MTHDETDDPGPSDEDLAAASRAGDGDAFAELWRRHARAGAVAARQYSRFADTEDVLAEAYTRILAALRRGGGPHGAFRPYLYRTIRNVALDARRPAELPLEETADTELLVPGPELAVAERTIAFRAFRMLPERWQSVLWYLEIEGMSPADAAPILGLTPNATSALAVRAREGLKRAWLQAHVNETTVADGCRWTTERMGEFSRGGLSARARARFERHLTSCEQCTRLLDEVGDATGRLAVLLLPLFLGGSAAATMLAGRSAEPGAGPAPGTGVGPTVFASRSSGATRGPALLVAGAAVVATIVAATIVFAATRTESVVAEPPVAVPTPEPKPPTPTPTPTPVPEAAPAPVVVPRTTSPLPPVVPPPASAPPAPTAPVIVDDPVTGRIVATGSGDVPGATIELWGTTTSLVTGITMAPTLLASSVVASDGSWATPEATGLTPINVTAWVVQVRDGLSSDPIELFAGAFFNAAAESTAATVAGGVATWEIHGWEGAEWVIRESPGGDVVASGTIGADGVVLASVPLPAAPSGAVLDYDYGYVQDGAIAASSPGLTAVVP